jgi:GNAT superfamily N-acetyltransferase
MSQRPYRLRAPEPGDLGWIVYRHGAIYGRDFGWKLEGLVAQVIADFEKSFDPAKERCWIAEYQGRPVGSIMLTKGSAEVARLRMLLIEPEVRGMGLGKHLVAECIAFAREAGYRQVTLWTHEVLKEARGIYQRAGFVRTEQKVHTLFGPPVRGETWDLDLGGR